MPKYILNDLTGRRFGKWQVLCRTENRVYPCGQAHPTYLCRCDCGYERRITYGHLVNNPTSEGGRGCTRSCINCFRRNAKIRNKNPRVFKFWDNKRKLNGTIPEWKEDAEPFYNHIMETYPGGNYLLRLVEPLLGLAPDNVHWMTRKEALNDGNRKGQVLITHNGVTKTMAEWAAIENVTRQAIENRIKYGSWQNAKREKIGYEAHVVNRRKRMKNGRYRIKKEKDTEK